VVVASRRNARLWCGSRPAGKRLAPALGELVARLSRLGELTVDDVTAALLSQMSAATIDRRLAPDRAKMQVRRSHTKPGSLLKDSIPIRTWAEWDEARPGFVEIDLVGHEGGNAVGEHCYTLTVTDIATGWTENRSVKNKAQKWVFAALVEIREAFPFPILGIDSDNGSEFINWHLFRYCVQEKITFTRSRSGNSNDGAHVEQKNWAVVRAVVGYHRYDTMGELLLLNKIWLLQGLLTNFFYPQQKLLSKQRQGAKVIKKYDVATTPYGGPTGRKEVPQPPRNAWWASTPNSTPRPCSGRSKPSAASCSTSPPPRQPRGRNRGRLHPQDRPLRGHRDLVRPRSVVSRRVVVESGFRFVPWG